jgi:hypothetical protein
MSDSTFTIRIPGSVWDDFLDPLTTGMASEIGFTTPRFVKRGKGYQAIFEGVTREQALEVAEYFTDRANTLLGQGTWGMSDDPDIMRERGVYRAALKAAERIRQQVRA